MRFSNFGPLVCRHKVRAFESQFFKDSARWLLSLSIRIADLGVRVEITILGNAPRPGTKEQTVIMLMSAHYLESTCFGPSKGLTVRLLLNFLIEVFVFPC